MGFLSWLGKFKKAGNSKKMHYNTNGFKKERVKRAIHVNTINDEF